MGGPQVVARYDYRTAGGDVLYQVERLQPKGFRQRRPDGAGGWAYNLDGTLRVPYRLPELQAAIAAGKWVMVVEGEKDADTLVAEGLEATTFAGGAGKWRPEYLEHFRGAKVSVITDNDDVGRKHALTVAAELEKVAAKVLMYQPDAACKDVTEHLEAGHPMKALRPFDWRAHRPKAAPEQEPPRTPLRVLSPREVMELPTLNGASEVLGTLVRIPNLCMVGAETGAGKTSMISQLAAAISRGGEFLEWSAKRPRRVLIIDLEQGTASVQRCLRQFGLTDADNVGIIHEPNGLRLDQDGAARSELESIFADFRPEAVFVDPAYAMWGGDMMSARAILEVLGWWGEWRRRYQFAQWLPGHIRKPPPGAPFTINEIFGTKASTWKAESVLGLRRLNDGAAELYWFKDREGDIAQVGSHWRLLFDPETGFRRDSRQHRESTALRIREALEKDPGLTESDLWFRLGGHDGGPSSKTIRNALGKLGATHDGERLVKDRRWFLPPSLLDDELAGVGGMLDGALG